MPFGTPRSEFERFQRHMERFVSASFEERIKIWAGVQERAKAEKEATSWQPMSPKEGPPLPIRFGIRWPWVKE